MKLSFIVPIYNTADYLPKCLESMLNQDLDHDCYEIILVDDGSTDSSLSICRQYAEKEKNITVLTQPNAGQSAARNKGLDLAKGTYIWFVDSDDYIEKNCIRDIVNQCDTLQTDLLLLCAEDHSTKGPKQRFNYDGIEKNTIWQGVNFINKPQYQHCVPFYIYRRALIEQYRFRFLEGVFHEDNELLPKIFYYAQRISPYNRVVYHVNLREGSTIRSVNIKKSYDLIVVSESLAAFRATAVNKAYQGLFADLISNAVNGSLLNGLKGDAGEQKELSKAWYEHRSLFRIMMKSHVLPYRCEGTIFALFPRSIVTIYKQLKRIR